MKGGMSAPPLRSFRLELSRGINITYSNSDRMCLFESPQRRAVRNIDVGEVERPARIVAARGIELGTMVCKCKQMSSQKIFEPGSGGLQMTLGIGNIASGKKDIGQPPAYLRIGTCNHRCQQRLCFI